MIFSWCFFFPILDLGVSFCFFSLPCLFIAHPPPTAHELHFASIPTTLVLFLASIHHRITSLARLDAAFHLRIITMVFLFFLSLSFPSRTHIVLQALLHPIIYHRIRYIARLHACIHVIVFISHFASSYCLVLSCLLLLACLLACLHHHI